MEGWINWYKEVTHCYTRPALGLLGLRRLHEGEGSSGNGQAAALKQRGLSNTDPFSGLHEGVSTKGSGFDN